MTQLTNSHLTDLGPAVTVPGYDRERGDRRASCTSVWAASTGPTRRCTSTR